jgi:hypothetical protein
MIESVTTTTITDSLGISLGALGAMVRTRDIVIADIDELVAESRAAGASWDQIAERLGVSRSTAHSLYGATREDILSRRRKAQAKRTKVLRAAGVAAG